MLFQRTCPGCGAPSGRSVVCGACAASEAEVVGPLDPPPGVDRLAALHHYDHRLARLVLAAKNGGQRGLLRHWGGSLADLVAGEWGRGAVVTWVPAHRSAARRRGYDQGRLLARGVAEVAGLRARRLLVRRPDRGQAGAPRVDRLDGPSLRAPGRVPSRVILVDDVVTTGASLSAAAAALRAAGTVEIVAAVVAVAGDRSELRPMDPDRSWSVGTILDQPVSGRGCIAGTTRRK
jgi:predicted amidophosphoribosyltransferase